MFKTVAMKKINVLTLERFVEPLTDALGDAGVVHLVDAARLSARHLLEGVSQSEDIADLQALVGQCRHLAQLLGVALVDCGPAADAAQPAGNEIVTYLNDLLAEFQNEDEAINRLIGESGTLAQKYDQLESFPLQRIRFGELQDLNFMYLQTGRMAPHAVLEAAQALGEKALVLCESVTGSREDRVMILASRKNRFATEAELKKAGFHAEELPGDATLDALSAMENVHSRLADVKVELERHRDKMARMAAANRDRLIGIHACLTRELTIKRAQETFGRAAGLYCVSGWIPASREDDLRERVNRATHGTAVVEVNLPPDFNATVEKADAAPVKLPDFAPLKSFQSLVSGFGTPRYGDLDPSPFVAFSFVLMFGIMFGDVGQGAVLVAVGLYMLFSKRPSLRRFAAHGYCLLFCGASATLFGFLYGSVFGNEEILPHLWLSPLHDVMTILAVTVGLGIVLISSGMLINIYNRLRARDYYQGVCASFGIFGVLFYWGAIALVARIAITRRIAPAEILILVGLPLTLLFVREPLYRLAIGKKPFHEDPFSFMTTSAIEVLETVMGLLANTVSFARVGAFALSHTALSFAIYAVVDAVRDIPGGLLLAGFTIVLGNAFVILLEGLIVAIQGVRLQYYELFSKYFPGDGIVYHPFSTQPSPPPEQGGGLNG